jgi:hypothetical protein
VTWEVTIPLVGVTTWIRGDCQITDTTGKILLPPLLSSIYLYPLIYLVSLACLCYLIRVACPFFHLALGEFELLKLCMLTLFKFRIKVLLTKRKHNSPPSWVIDPYTGSPPPRAARKSGQQGEKPPSPLQKMFGLIFGMCKSQHATDVKARHER